MELNPQAEQGTSDIAALVAGAPGVSNLDIQVETVVAPVGALVGEYQLEAREELQVGTELIDPSGVERPYLPQLTAEEAQQREVGEYVGDGATDDTVVSQETQLVVPDFMKDDPLATAPQQELMRMAFYQMFPTIVSPRADTRASYQHGQLSQVTSVVDIGRGMKGPRRFKVMVDALPRHIDKKGRAMRVKMFAANVAGLVPAA